MIVALTHVGGRRHVVLADKHFSGQRPWLLRLLVDGKNGAVLVFDPVPTDGEQPRGGGDGDAAATRLGWPILAAPINLRSCLGSALARIGVTAGTLLSPSPLPRTPSDHPSLCGATASATGGLHQEHALLWLRAQPLASRPASVPAHGTLMAAARAMTAHGVRPGAPLRPATFVAGR